MDRAEKPLEWSLIVPVSNQRVLHSTLLRSPVVDERCEVILKRYHASAAGAFNEGIEQATGEFLVLAHQDVYLPPGWSAALARAITRLEANDPQWGVLGPIGVDLQGEVRGHVYSTGLGDYVGAAFNDPIGAFTLDEMVLVLRRGAGLRFDEGLPGFHLYGADICLEAARRGLASYVVPAFCLHNSNGLARLPREFWRAYLYLRRKWRDRLPIHTCCTTITRGCWPMLRKGMRDFMRVRFGPDRVGTRKSDPDLFYRELLAAGRSPV